MSGKLRSTLVMLQPLKGDEVQAALSALGTAIEELDRAAHDAGFRVRLIVVRGDGDADDFRGHG
jgi:hypothetical protein